MLLEKKNRGVFVNILNLNVFVYNLVSITFLDEVLVIVFFFVRLFVIFILSV